jgi:sister chromatid cohesion protein DCC1
LVIRGDENENAVCWSNDKTFAFKVAEISNPLFASSNLILSDNKQIDNQTTTLKLAKINFMTSTYFELSQTRPKLTKLKYLLELNLFCGTSNDLLNNFSKKYTIDDFLNEIQSSETEIYTYLNYLEAYNIDGYWRLIDFDYFVGLVEQILKLIDENSWSYDEIQIEQLYADLKDLYPLCILKQFVKYYLIKKDLQNYQINRLKICRLYAEILLKKTFKMRFDEFMNLWQKCVPFSMNIDVSMLNGLAYREDNYVVYLNLVDLPDDIDKRFKFLFEKRKKWSFDEIRNYFSDIIGSDLNTLIVRNCRAFNENGIKYVTSK